MKDLIDLVNVSKPCSGTDLCTCTSYPIQLHSYISFHVVNYVAIVPIVLVFVYLTPQCVHNFYCVYTIMLDP